MRHTIIVLKLIISSHIEGPTCALALRSRTHRTQVQVLSTLAPPKVPAKLIGALL